MGGLEERLQRRLVRAQIVCCGLDHLVHHGDDKMKESRDDALDALEREVRQQTRPAVHRAVNVVRQQRDVLRGLLLVFERRRSLEQVRKRHTKHFDGGEVIHGGKEVRLSGSGVELVWNSTVNPLVGCD